MKKILRATVLAAVIAATATTTANAAKLNRKEVKTERGESTELKLNGAKGKVKWKVKGSAVRLTARSGDGTRARVKAVKPGRAVVTAKSGGRTYRCKFTVRRRVETHETMTVEKGQSVDAYVGWSTKNAKIEFDDGQKAIVKVKPSKGAIRVTGLKVGKTTFVVRAGKNAERMTVYVERERDYHWSWRQEAEKRKRECAEADATPGTEPQAKTERQVEIAWAPEGQIETRAPQTEDANPK